ncbi:MAG: SDR family oxidoreductase [Gammaproteobacteria bacterium]|nr:SDR family oxidoreductase [Gammaproteobacteria bacterium]NNC96935.1 SDR family oxidoreductase [Gammaproteobacteria bacterium]NNM13350.1 SDR family oxidoreductase [Gammaproteobacteria bacterium]
MNLKDKLVLITGASAGIGTALAHQYAKYGANFVLVARRKERLQELAAALKDKYGAESLCISADLAEPDAPQAILDQVSAAGKNVDILINNAGYGVPGKYLSVDWKTHADFNQVMITAVMHLTYLFLPHMVEQGYGRIINIASLAGFMPGTEGHTCYAAVKHWMIPFTESLHFEYGHKGIHATAVCPGFTYSEFHDITGTREQVNKMSKRMWMTADEVAEQALDASEAGKVVLINGKLNNVIAGAIKLMPKRLQYYVMSKQSKNFRKTD